MVRQLNFWVGTVDGKVTRCPSRKFYCQLLPFYCTVSWECAVYDCTPYPQNIASSQKRTQLQTLPLSHLLSLQLVWCGWWYGFHSTPHRPSPTFPHRCGVWGDATGMASVCGVGVAWLASMTLTASCYLIPPVYLCCVVGGGSFCVASFVESITLTSLHTSALLYQLRSA